MVWCPTCHVSAGDGTVRHKGNTGHCYCQECHGTEQVDQKTIFSPLEQTVINAIEESIPLNLMCPTCEREMEAECIIDSSNWHDRKEWKQLIQKIVSIVKESK